MRRRFPKRIWLVNNASQRGDSAEVCRNPKTAAMYQASDMRARGWEVVEYVRAAAQSSRAAHKDGT